MFIKDNSAARVKTVENVFQGQESPIQIGNSKYSNQHTEIGFFEDGPNSVVNAYFDPFRSARADGYDLKDIGYVQVGGFSINNFFVPVTTHDAARYVRQLGFPWANGEQNVLFVDAYEKEPPSPYVPSPFFLNYQFEQNERFRVSNFPKYPQNFGSFVSVNRKQLAPPTVFAENQYKKVFMSRSFDMNPLNIEGELSFSDFLKTYDFSPFTLNFEIPEFLDNGTTNGAQILNYLDDRGAVPPYRYQEFTEKIISFIDINGKYGFYLIFDAPVRGKRSLDDVTYIVFTIWDTNKEKFGFFRLRYDEIKSEYEEAIRTSKIPDADRILSDLEIFGFRRSFGDTTNIEMKYVVKAAPVCFFPIRLHETTVGYKVLLLEGFEYVIKRKYNYFGGWQPVEGYVPSEFLPHTEGYSQNAFRQVLTAQLKDTYGDRFKVKYI